MMRYQEALRDGLPISTGVIEGACRHVVKDRRTGRGSAMVADGRGGRAEAARDPCVEGL
jgi:hypothetical protein